MSFIREEVKGRMAVNYKNISTLVLEDDPHLPGHYNIVADGRVIEKFVAENYAAASYKFDDFIKDANRVINT